MSELIVLKRKLADIDHAMREAKRMDEKQQRMKSSHSAMYDEQLHNAGLSQAAQSIYTRLKDVLKGILKLSDGSVPASASWRRDLLLQASTAVLAVPSMRTSSACRTATT